MNNMKTLKEKITQVLEDNYGMLYQQTEKILELLQEEKECLGCNTLPADNPFHTHQPNWEKEFDEMVLPHIGGEFYKGIKSFIRNLLQEDRQKWVEEILKKLGDEYLEDLKWAVNPILEWTLGIPPKDIDEESVYELAGEIKENLKKLIKSLTNEDTNIKRRKEHYI